MKAPEFLTRLGNYIQGAWSRIASRFSSTESAVPKDEIEELIEEVAELRSIMRGYAMGRRHEQERFKEIVRDGEPV